MAGLGQENQGINVPVGPLVTPAMPVGQEAVDSMVRAFRAGQINSQDIVDRFGMKARAETQLGTAQAEAALPLVEPTAQLQQAKMASELAQTNWGQTSLKTAQETMGWFGDTMENYKLPNGQTDFQKLAKVGAQRVAQLGQVDAWANMLKPISSRTVTLGDGTEKVQYLNSLNQDVTPPSDGYDGSEQYWHYITQLQEYLPQSHPLTRIYPVKWDATLKPYDPKDSQAVSAGHPAVEAGLVQGPSLAPGSLALGPHLIKSKLPESINGPRLPLGASPETAEVRSMRQNLVTAGRSPEEVAAMGSDEVVAASPIKDVMAAAAKTPETSPVIQPPVHFGARPSGGVGGITTKHPKESVFTAESIRENLMKEPPYQNWQKMVPYATTFEASAETVKNLTPAQQKSTNMNTVDLGLAESLIKMYDPEGTIREFKWDKFEKNQPIFDRLANWQAEFKKLGTFTPETRAELVRMGEEVIAGREKAARPYIEKAVNQARSRKNIDPGTVFTSEDERILAGRIVKDAYGGMKAGTGGVRGVSATEAPGPGWVAATHPKFGAIWMNGLNYVARPTN